MTSKPLLVVSVMLVAVSALYSYSLLSSNHFNHLEGAALFSLGSSNPFNHDESSALPIPCTPKVRYDACSCEGWCATLPFPINTQKKFQECAAAQQKPILGIGNCSFHRSGPSSPHLEARYIDSVKRIVTGLVYGNFPGQMDGGQWPPGGSFALTMIGLRRLEHLQFLLEEVIRLNIPGDFIETGVWRGGASIFASAIFQAYSQTCPSSSCRRVFIADSFKGIPPVDVEHFPEDAAHVSMVVAPIMILSDNSEERVLQSFARCNLLTESLVSLPGWFKDTLPKARLTNFTKFAVIRLDGDSYESTWQGLENLYDLLAIGGFVIIDDYSTWIGCLKAVDDFRAKFNITSEIRPIYHEEHENINGVWWQKREP